MGIITYENDSQVWADSGYYCIVDPQLNFNLFFYRIIRPERLRVDVNRPIGMLCQGKFLRSKFVKRR